MCAPAEVGEGSLMCPMLGTSPSCIGECLVFSPGIDGAMVTSAISAASAFAIEQPVRVRKSRVFAQLGQIREREREKILKHYLVSPQF